MAAKPKPDPAETPENGQLDGMPDPMQRVHTSFAAVKILFDRLPEVGDEVRLVLGGHVSKRSEAEGADGRESWSITVTHEARVIGEKEYAKLMQGTLDPGDGEG